jgi:uncharacterized protein YciI
MSTDMHQFICFLEPTRPGMPSNPTPEEAQAASDHFAYYKTLHEQGTLILAGRTQEPPIIGIMIFEAESKDAADVIVKNDPAILAGVFKARVQSYQVALSQTGPSF